MWGSCGETNKSLSRFLIYAFCDTYYNGFEIGNNNYTAVDLSNLNNLLRRCIKNLYLENKNKGKGTGFQFESGNTL